MAEEHHEGEVGGNVRRRFLPLEWGESTDMPTLFANLFRVQFQQDEIVLTIAQYVTPTLLGSEEERSQQLAAIDSVPVRVVGQFGSQCIG